MTANNIVGWFEIPVIDMERAIGFYETVLGIKLDRNQLDGLDMAWFPFEESGLGCSGSLVHNPDFYKPSTDGTLIYITPRSGDLAIELSRVEAAGGKVLMPKKLIAETIGYMGLFLDSEGNRIAIHTRY
jgi:predicted enzyme related to lactoylglutathione lyase